MIKKVLLVGPVADTLGGKGVAGVARHIESLAGMLPKERAHVYLWYHRQNVSLNPQRGIWVIGHSLIQKILMVITGLFSIYLRNRASLSCYSLFQKLIIAYQYSFLRGFLKNNRVDVIHVHSLNSLAGFSLSLLKGERALLSRIVYTDHGFWQNPGLSNKRNNPALCNIKTNIEIADRVIYISNFAKKKGLEFGLFSSKFCKISNPVSLTENNMQSVGKMPKVIEKFLLENEGKKIVFFNGFTESIKIKRLDLVVRAIENNNWLRNNVALICICNNTGHKYINNNLPGFKVLPLAKQPREYVNYLYRGCDCLVNPSTSESFGLVYIEALQYGKPVVGFRRVIEEFSSTMDISIGEGFDGDNPDDIGLGEKIERVLQSNWNHGLLAEKAEKFSWKYAINHFLQLYGI